MKNIVIALLVGLLCGTWCHAAADKYSSSTSAPQMPIDHHHEIPDSEKGQNLFHFDKDSPYFEGKLQLCFEYFSDQFGVFYATEGEAREKLEKRITRQEKRVTGLVSRLRMLEQKIKKGG